MTRFGYHASHEQFSPGALLGWVRRAEAAGFAGAMSSDHLLPWTAREGAESAFAWSWLGAAMEATRLPFGVVTSPVGYRYHPVVTAQAIATLATMYPGRFWAALGTGEALNEHVTGERWPPKDELRTRLEEAVDVIRRLLAGTEVTHEGLLRVDRARLYTRPREPPPLLAAATTPATAQWAASWADGLITINAPDDGHRAVIDAFRDHGGDGKPVKVQVHLALADTPDDGLRVARDRWGAVALPGTIMETLPTPEAFDDLHPLVTPEHMDGYVQVADGAAGHVEPLRRYVDLDVDEVLLHHVGLDQERFIDAFGKEVLPALQED